MKKTSISIYILMMTFALIPPQAWAEYIKATNQDEMILVPTVQEINMGRSLSKNVEKKFVLDDNAQLQERIERIGQRIAAACDRKELTYRFRVLKGEGLEPEQKINAFALPGGYVYLFSDMVKMAAGEDEIAAIIAHEVGHVAAKHSIKRLQGSLGAMALNIISARMSHDTATRGEVQRAIGELMMSYSREDETMADRLSVRYLKRAGYDPRAAIRFVEKMQALQRSTAIREFSSYRSHPYLAERKSVIKDEIYGKMDFVDFMNCQVRPGGG